MPREQSLADLVREHRAEAIREAAKHAANATQHKGLTALIMRCRARAWLKHHARLTYTQTRLAIGL